MTAAVQTEDGTQREFAIPQDSIGKKKPLLPENRMPALSAVRKQRYTMAVVYYHMISHVYTGRRKYENDIPCTT
jgi:hypothetical protein